MARPRNLIPTMNHHRTSGQAYVIIGGKQHYLGAYGQPEALANYRQAISPIASKAPLTEIDKQLARLKSQRKRALETAGNLDQQIAEMEQIRELSKQQKLEEAKAQALASSPMDLLTEDLMTMEQAASEIPGGVHIGTLYRWAANGIDGVKLETVRLGSKRRTSVQALHRFLKRTQ